jgi:hypothetical protein
VSAAASIKLYELVEARDTLDLFIAEEEGEVTPTIAELFEGLEGDLATKGQRVAQWMREKEAEIAALKIEEKFLARKRQARERALESSKAYFVGLLVQLDRKEIGTPIAKLCRQASAPSLAGELTETQLACIPVDGPAAAAVKLVPATFTLDRRAALELLKSGVAIEGLAIAHTEHLRIR